tara:strand:- start:235 stop:564 length:330 start_codon:yes stop_codon:yes gene_type:complete
MITIPFQDSPDFLEEITLENTPYVLRFTFNSRGNFWTMDILDRDENDLINGVRLLLGVEFLRQHPDIGLPLGMMFVIDETGDTTPIQQGDFLSERVKLTYATEAEVEAV